MADLLPLFLNLTGRDVLLVGGGRVAEAKLQQLLAAGARVRVVAPAITESIRDVARGFQPRDRGPERAAPHLELAERGFEAADLEEVWLVVAAATPDVNRAVADAAEARRVFVNAVDDPANASAFLSGVVRREGVTIAISTSGDAPALTALLRESLDAVLPRDLAAWVQTAREERIEWRRDAVPMEARKPRLLRALNALYRTRAENAEHVEKDLSVVSTRSAVDGDPNVPWLNGPEDSWL